MSNNFSNKMGGMEKNCSRCGRCCQEVYLPVDKAYTEDGLDHLEWAHHHGLKIAYREDSEGKRLWGVELDSPCMHLRVEADGKTTCAIYESRPQMCRDYNGGKDFPECSYR
jgi:Fe-S-cluster containining protein